MAEKSEENNVLIHLIQVEKDASCLIDEALKDAETKLSQSRSDYNQKYKEKYEAIVTELEERFREKTAELKNEHEKCIQEFKDSLINKNQDKQAFNSLLNKYLYHSN